MVVVWSEVRGFEKKKKRWKKERRQYFSPPSASLVFFVPRAFSPRPSPLSARTDARRPIPSLSPPSPSHLDVLVPLEPVEPLEQPVRVRGDPQHPLLHRQADHGVPAAFAHAPDDLLVGEDRAQGGAPVDGHRGLVGQALVEKLQEDPLRPLVVARVRRRELAGPVVGEAEGLELLAEAVDVLFLVFFWVGWGGREREEGGENGNGRQRLREFFFPLKKFSGFCRRLTPKNSTSSRASLFLSLSRSRSPVFDSCASLLRVKI